MPINEAEGYRLNSNLSAREQKDAVENLYGAGAPPNPGEPQQAISLSYEEQQKMRQYLDQLAQKEAGVKEFDLARPPVGQYRYREFPFMLYRGKVAKAAQNHMERESMMAQGWSPQPPEPEGVEHPDLPMLAADVEESHLVDYLLKMPKDERETLLATVRGEAPAQTETEPKSKRTK